MYVISASNLYLYFTIFKYPLSTNKSTFMYAKAAQHNAVPLSRLFAYNNLTECACNRNCRFTGSYCYCAVGIGRECCRRHCYSALNRFKHACCFIIGVLGIIKRRAVIAYRNAFENGVEHITQHNIIGLCDRRVALVRLVQL